MLGLAAFDGNGNVSFSLDDNDAGTLTNLNPTGAYAIADSTAGRFTLSPPGVSAMGGNLIMWFIYSIVISLFAGYIASRALTRGADYLEVFRFVGAAAFMGYALGLWQMSIWYGRGWGLTVKGTLDGLLYALLTAGTFGWLWPR